MCGARGKAIGGGKSSTTRSIAVLSRYSLVGFGGVTRGYGAGVERAAERERVARGRDGAEPLRSSRWIRLALLSREHLSPAISITRCLPRTLIFQSTQL